MIIILLIFLTSLSCLFMYLMVLRFLFRKHSASRKTSRRVSGKDAILISGCDSGVGLELTKHFLKSFELKIICGFLNLGQSEGYKELQQLDRDDRLTLVKLDLTSSDDINGVTALINSLIADKSIKNLIALVNNAGLLTYGEFDWLTWDQIQTQIDVNLIGTLRLTRAILPYIIESRGNIVNVSSVNDTTVFPGLSIYSATKSALSAFSRGLGYELRKFGAHVVTVRLGDFARLTNIMKNHVINRDNMWNEMNSKKKGIYKDFFSEFNNHLLLNYGMTSPKEFKDSSFFNDFELAILSENPPSSITCAPLAFKVFYYVIELTPIWIQFHILDFLIQFGFRWKPPQVIY